MTAVTQTKVGKRQKVRIFKDKRTKKDFFVTFARELLIMGKINFFNFSTFGIDRPFLSLDLLLF